jgi:hypothetical protein
VSASVSSCTTAFVFVGTIDALAVDAWIRCTFVHVNVAVASCPASSTLALPSTDEVLTSSAVATWRRLTFIHVCLASIAREAWSTLASVAGVYVDTRGAVETTVILTVILISRFDADGNIGFRSVVAFNATEDETLGVLSRRLWHKQDAQTIWC